MRVLAVDDDRITRKLITILLGKLDLTCTVACDVDEAIGLIAEVQPHVVLSDWMMPGKTGSDLCKHIRSNSSIEQPFIVCLSGLEGDAALEEAYAVGVDFFLAKPIRLSSLTRCVNLVWRILKIKGLNSNLSPNSMPWNSSEHKAIIDQLGKQPSCDLKLCMGVLNLNYSSDKSPLFSEINTNSTSYIDFSELQGDLLLFSFLIDEEESPLCALDSLVDKIINLLPGSNPSVSAIAIDPLTNNYEDIVRNLVASVPEKHGDIFIIE